MPVQGAELDVTCPLPWLSTICFETQSLIDLELNDSARLAGQREPGILAPALPALALRAHTSLPTLWPGAKD